MDEIHIPSQPLCDGLIRLLSLIPKDADPWWIIGSTAMLLAGAEGIQPHDIDLLSSAATVSGVLRHAGQLPPEPIPSGRFHSHPFARISSPAALSIEVMGDLAVFSDGEWQRVWPKSRQAVRVAGVGTVYIPDAAEQIEIKLLFGRKKDQEKIAVLQKIAAAQA